MTLLQIHVWWIIVVESQIPNGKKSIINIFQKINSVIYFLKYYNFMIYYDIVAKSEIIQIVAYNNYDSFQHLNFEFCFIALRII
jgi:hypothetical protein